MNKDPIRCEAVAFGFEQQLLLSSVSFTIAQGDFAAIIGSNGTGKSSLMRLLLGELQPRSGAIHLFGQPVKEKRDWTDVGYLPQHVAAARSHFPATVLEVVEAHLYDRRKKEGLGRKDVRDLSMEALRQLGMDAYARRLLRELSGGQQQRAMLAGVLLAKPKLLLLDEPEAGIDYESSLTLYRLLVHLQEAMQIAILMITHQLREVSDYAKRLLCLEGGYLHELTEAEILQEQSHRHRHPMPGLKLDPCAWEGCETKGGEHV